jgi:hypothetical protein
MKVDRDRMGMETDPIPVSPRLCGRENRTSAGARTCAVWRRGCGAPTHPVSDGFSTSKCGIEQQRSKRASPQRNGTRDTDHDSTRPALIIYAVLHFCKVVHLQIRESGGVMGGPLSHQTGATGGFFAVDSRIWPKVCELGMNEPIVYLVQARGTARDNRTTTWSVDSIERYTGISRHRAAAAIKRIQDAGLARLLRGGTKPKYDLVPFSELPGADPRPELKLSERIVVDWIRRGIRLDRKDQRHARSAAKKGWLLESEGEFVVVPAPEIKPDWIWLPNELVTGAAGEIPPLELVRQTQDPMILRLLIEMYHAQNLREDGGVSRRFMWKTYDRVKVGEHAQFTVWGFHGGREWVNWENGLTLPHRREKLTDQEIAAGEKPGGRFLSSHGALERTRDIRMGATSRRERRGKRRDHPPAKHGPLDSIEDRLGRAAHEAGKALITEGQCDWVLKNGIHHLVPVPRHIANVQMIGIARLRYRPHTQMTAVWWADLKVNAEKHLARYAQIAARQKTRIAV